VSDDDLAKDLGPLAALTIGVGTMIGAGIFVLPGTAIESAGSFAVLSFLLGGGIALLTAFSASELGTAMPRSGGAYFYVNKALGPLFGSVAGWANWMGLAFASAFYMMGFGQYIVAIVPTINLGFVVVEPSVKLIALAGGALFVFVNYVGAKETGRLQNVIVVLLVIILAIFTVVGSLRADPANLPVGKGISPMLTTTGLIFVSYLGFVQITSVAEEIKEPGKNLPRAVIGSVVIVTIIYGLVLVVMSAAVEQGFIAQSPASSSVPSGPSRCSSGDSSPRHRAPTRRFSPPRASTSRWAETPSSRRNSTRFTTASGRPTARLPSPAPSSSCSSSSPPSTRWRRWEASSTSSSTRSSTSHSS
jgi:amino acid transporter